MPGRIDKLKSSAISTVMQTVMTEAQRLGHTPKSLEEAQRDTFWWLWARIQAGMSIQRLLRGWGIAWTSAGYAELVPAEVPRAGRGKVTVLIHTSAVSPGTERAQYLHLPNAAVGILGRPGYSASGVVVDVGTGVTGLSKGDAVAVIGAPHASVATVPATQAVPIPAGVSMQSASLVQLGVICGQGVRRAELDSHDGFAVVGAGLVGALALRLGARQARPLAVIATSRSKERIARTGGAESFLVTGEDDDAVASLGAPVVIEATGSPDGIAVAVRAAGPGGLVVLLGSPRGITTDLSVDEIQRKRLRLVGAHVDTLDADSERLGIDARRREADEFMAALAAGLDVADLLGDALDPREAGLFYRELARDGGVFGAHFDWTRLVERERIAPGRIVRLPNLIGRGMEPTRPLPARRRSRSSLFELGDPFEGATGNLRIGLLGCGDIAIHNAGAIASAPNTELVACFDPVKSLAEDLARKHEAEAVESSDALFAHPKVDAVFLSVPHHLHAPLAIQAARAGKHVIVEKPPANNLAGALEMAAAADEAGVTLSVCFPQRYDARVQIVRRLVAAGAIGEFGGATVKHYLDKSPAYWIAGFSGRSPSTWRSSRERAGGGVLIMNLSHHLDLVRHVTGADTESLTAVADSVDQPSEVEDAVTVGVRFAGGAVGTVIGSSAVRGTVDTEMRIWGRDGHIVFEPTGSVYTLRAIDGIRTARWQSFGRRLPNVPMRAVYVSRLGSAIAEGRAPDVTAADGIAVQSFIEAAYRSAETGCKVSPSELVAETSP